MRDNLINQRLGGRVRLGLQNHDIEVDLCQGQRSEVTLNIYPIYDISKSALLKSLLILQIQPVLISRTYPENWSKICKTGKGTVPK